MRVTVNGAEHDLPDDATVADAVAETGRADGHGVAVALDGTLVPRTRWGATCLADGARLEILTAVQGG